MSKSEKSKPKLTFCKENIIHILEDFNRAVRMGDIVLSSGKHGRQPIYHQEQYSPIRSNKTVITNARKHPETEWTRINEVVFRSLIDVLYEHKDKEGNRTLTLWDNAALYRNEEAVYHSRNYFYKSDLESEIADLVGTYRTFKIATNDFESVLIGRLEIKMLAGTNILTTRESAVYKPEKDAIPYVYKGTIHYHQDENTLIWEDAKEHSPSVRHTRLRIRKTDGGLDMEGFMLVNLDGSFVRRIFIDSKKLSKETPSTVHYTSDKIPEEFKIYLTPQSIQKLEFSAGT